MQAGDITAVRVTLGDTTKARCVTPQAIAFKWVARRVTQMTQIHRRVLHACAPAHTRMQNSREKRHLVSCVTRRPARGQLGKVQVPVENRYFLAVNRSLRLREQHPLQTDFPSLSGPVRSRSRLGYDAGPCGDRQTVGYPHATFRPRHHTGERGPSPGGRGDRAALITTICHGGRTHEDRE